jgi:hypothetical protein
LLGRYGSNQQRDALKQLFPYADFSKYVDLAKIFQQVETERAERFIRSYREAEYPKPDLEHPLGRNYLSGNVLNGYFQFSTREGDITPYLLEIAADNKAPHYRVHNVFGGCSRGMSILLYDKVN